MKNSLNRRAVRPLAVFAACLLVAACGKSATDAKPASQVAVKVNDVEITVHQLNQVLSRAGALSPEQSKVASRRALDQLVDQQLLVQKATEAKLDRSPEVMAALDASRRQILAQAYMEKAVAGAVAKPGTDEVRKFYDARPELFAERRIYRLQELATSAIDANKLPALAELIGKTKNLNDIVAFLRTNDIKFNANSAVRPAEQLPLDTLPMLAKMKDGEIAAMRNGGRFTIVQRVSAALTPLSVEEATPYIEQFLATQKRNELAGAEIKQLRQSAKVEFVGEFAQQAAAPASAAAVPSSAVTPAATGSMPAPETASKPAAAGMDAAIEKGLKGLK